MVYINYSLKSRRSQTGKSTEKTGAKKWAGVYLVRVYLELFVFPVQNQKGILSGE